MKQLLTAVFLTVFLTGCATMKSVNNKYGKVDYTNGISKEEAKSIAKKSLMESKARGKYRFTVPMILDDPYTKPNLEYWYISFSKKIYHLRSSHYLVVINKHTGEIEYSDKKFKYPHPVKGYRWINYLDNPQPDWHIIDSGKITKK